ncbi:putative E3 ubiquitin-protein ligase RHA2B [Platanthera guangdongensis]|uniref:E3 ubiquitin-protein ligase RHA2B n=1 Tax=Platanthera guangdongensis TaxID=2320717 RepID=A0ABR2MMM6_9ASPA
MGFPVGYPELLFPKLLIHLILFLNLLRRLIHGTLSAAGIGHLLEPDLPWPDPYPYAQPPPDLASASAIFIQEILPVVLIDELLQGEGEMDLRPVADFCAVCLYQFEAREEVRRLRNCRHVFHRGCIDRWMDHDQRTCPLCRTTLIPEEMQDAFDRVRAAGESDSYPFGEFDSSPNFSISPPPSSS